MKIQKMDENTLFISRKIYKKVFLKNDWIKPEHLKIK